MDIVERFPSISLVLTAPTPLEHFSNIIKMSKVGQNSSPYHELCGDFKDNSIKAKETLNMHAMSIFAPSPCIHGILTQELRLIMYLEVWWGLMYDLLTKSYNHIHKLMGLGLHVLHHLMLRISHIYIYIVIYGNPTLTSIWVCMCIQGQPCCVFEHENSIIIMGFT